MRCGHCSGEHSTVDEVKKCSMLPTLPDRRRPATENQRNYAHGLLRSNEPVEPVKDIELTNSLEAAHEFINSMDFHQISDFIDKMTRQPKRKIEERTVEVLVGEGMYRRDEVVYKVQRAVHGSGHLYCKRLVPTTNEDGSSGGKFIYAPGMLSALTPEDAMSLKEAKEFGQLYGMCCVCGRTLTDESSIEAGIGPICAGKRFWA